MSDDKRSFTRIPFQMNTEVVIEDETYSTDKITNLSVGGCFLPIKINPEPETTCSVRIILEGTTEEIAVQVEGKIVRVTPEGLAVDFVSIDPDSLFHLQNIVKYNSPDADVIENEIAKHQGIL